MRIRALICAGLLCCLLGSTARAERQPYKPGTTFEAKTKGAPAATMTGQWDADGRSARFVFGGAQVVGTRTDMRATWTTAFGPKSRTAEVTVECNRFSGSMEHKVNKWSVEILILPKEGYGRATTAYRTRVPMPEIGSGEGIAVTIESFRPQRWKYHVVIEADLVTPSEMSGVCTMEAG